MSFPLAIGFTVMLSGFHQMDVHDLTYPQGEVVSPDPGESTQMSTSLTRPVEKEYNEHPSG